MSPGARRRRLLLLGAAVPAFGTARAVLGDDKPFSPFVTSPQVAVVRMLELARTGPGDHVIDLGSGDGRIPIVAASRFGATAHGVDLDARLVELSQANARAAGVAQRVSFARQDVFVTDVSKATVVTLYLLPPIVQALRPRLLGQMRVGSRIVSHDFPFDGWQADEQVTFFAPDKNDGRGGESTVFLYLVPAQVHGRWQMSVAGGSIPGGLQLQVSQQNQMLDAEIHAEGRVFEARDGRLRGDRIGFVASLPERPAGPPVRLWRFEGQVDGASIGGIVRDEAGRELRWQARRIAVR
jgi:SAM-dependent methyltransferase